MKKFLNQIDWMDVYWIAITLCYLFWRFKVLAERGL